MARMIIGGGDGMISDTYPIIIIIFIILVSNITRIFVVESQTLNSLVTIQTNGRRSCCTMLNHIPTRNNNNPNPSCIICEWINMRQGSKGRLHLSISLLAFLDSLIKSVRDDRRDRMG